jgi:oxygen-independent coproporphyrinogen-3 oxidase
MGVYVHVPFCSRQCDFCAFYKEKPEKSAVEGYLEAIEIELDRWGPGRAVDTVFIGGGTPSLLNASDLGRLCGAIRRALVKVGTDFNKLEWTIEMAPSSVKPDKLELLNRWG